MLEDKDTKKSLALITNATYFPIYFKKKLDAIYHITPVDAQDFTLEDIKFIFADVIVIDDKPFGNEIFKLLTQIRRMPNYHDKPIIIITAKLKKSYIDLLIKAGANDFIREPLEDKDVLDRLKNVEKYHEMSSKLHTLAGKMTSSSEVHTTLKDRFLLNKLALQPMHRTIKEGGYICVMFLSVDQKMRLTEEGFNDMTNHLKVSVRNDDLLFAIGHGVFLVMLDNTAAKKGFMIAQSLKDDVSSNKFSAQSGKEAFTLSIGMAAQTKPPYKDLSYMIRDAKNALTLAEKNGNQIIIHT